jgi:hypothetical protein
MKTRALVMAGLVAVTMLASTRVARAQEQILVNVPFDFVAGNKTLPAGEYAVKTIGPTHTLVLIDRNDATASAFLTTNPVVASEPQSESKLVFNRYGDRYFLAQVWTAGYASGRQLMKSDREKEVSLSSRIETKGQVTLVASLLRTNP